jgi:hypothetical protein
MTELSSTTIGVIVLVFALALGLFARGFWSAPRRHERALRKALRRIGLASLIDRVIPDGVDGEIQIDLIVLTARGLLVLEVKRVEGTVFGAASVDQWTALTPTRRIAFDNPLELMHRRIIALKGVLGEDVPVEGRVVLVGEVTLGADLPDVVMTPATLIETFDPTSGKADASPYFAHWEQLRQTAPSE